MPAFLITGRVMFHHPDKSGLSSDVLAFAFRLFLQTLRSWAKKFTDRDPTVNINPKVIIQDHGAAETLKRNSESNRVKRDMA